MLLISALLLLQSQFCVPVTVSSNKPKVEIHEKEDAVLSCVFKTERDSHPRIEWKKKGREISYVYFNGTFRGGFAGRARLEGATVTLYRATLRDSGEYRCEISAPLDSNTLGEAEVSLRVLVPPHTPQCEIPGWALVGGVVELRCVDELSFPPATYRWYRNNQPLSAPRHGNHTYSLDPQRGTLLFRAVSPADSGKYRCEASNGVGTPKSCEGKHLKIDMYDMKMMMIIVAAAGGFLFLCVCALGVCCFCCWRRRSRLERNEKGKGRSSSSSLPNPQHYRHTQSFVL
ncbi:junctional adhesion molecule 2A-like [Conger conger]|uniref:junctional adhesion molecule 2A-like n=1 Tax=Conger conger TaxID=82655 RepID=UPI002A59B069|nr:junctional adhesion molecule 2A-like [Conger conger]